MHQAAVSGMRREDRRQTFHADSASSASMTFAIDRT